MHIMGFLIGRKFKLYDDAWLFNNLPGVDTKRFGLSQMFWVGSVCPHDTHDPDTEIGPEVIIRANVRTLPSSATVTRNHRFWFFIYVKRTSTSACIILFCRTELQTDCITIFMHSISRTSSEVRTLTIPSLSLFCCKTARNSSSMIFWNFSHMKKTYRPWWEPFRSCTSHGIPCVHYLAQLRLPQKTSLSLLLTNLETMYQ